MKIKCVKCGTEFETLECGFCHKGVFEEKTHIFSDKEWVCSWCGYSYISDYPHHNYNCPSCKFNNTPKGGCYITTACVESKGLADNCYELNLIRKFRDEIMKKDKKWHPIVTEYYFNAPMIVENINKLDNHQTIYNEIYSNMIAPCIKAIENKENDKAVDIYLTSYKHLCNKYLKN